MLSPVTEIKERLSIVDVISGYVKLEKAGIHFKARCPFHNEKTPSFFVSPERNSYHCFGCGRGGDIFTFVQEIEGLDFTEALKMLASRAGVVLEKVKTSEKKEEVGLEHALEEATAFYEARLREDQNVIAYLKKRGMTGETAKKFRIGYAPDGWRNLAHHLESKKIPLALAEKAGLVVKSDKGDKGYYDRFRSRIMFPIAAPNGKVVAFSGRIFPESADPATAKYINSPETPLYNKSKVLFGYDKAKHAILRANSCIIVEGQMDLCMAHQAGTANTVAVSGTALTKDHLKLIKRFTETVILSFDSDSAGLSASKRSVTAAFEVGMDVLAVALPQGKDPADVIRENPEEWEKAIANARPFIEFYLNLLTEKILDPRTFKKEVTKEILPLLGMVQSSIDQAHFVSIIAERLRVPEAAVRDELKRISKNIPGWEESPPQDAPSTTASERIRRGLVGGYLWKPLPEVSDAYEKITGTTLEKDCAKIPEPELQSLILQAELTYGTPEQWKKESTELLLSLEKELLDRKFETLLADLKNAETEKDIKKGMELLKESHTISKRIQELKDRRISK